MNYRTLATLSFVMVTGCFGYEATIINHTPWELKGRPTRSWKKMEDRTIKPYQKEKWDSGAALITGVTLDLMVAEDMIIKEVLKESYVGRAVSVMYHIFAEPFLDDNGTIKKFKLILVREPAGGIGKTAYPGGIVIESTEIELQATPPATARIAYAKHQKTTLKKGSTYHVAFNKSVGTQKH